MGKLNKMFEPKVLVIMLIYSVNGAAGWISAAYQDIANGVGVSYEQVTYIFGSFTTIITLVTAFLTGLIAGKLFTYRTLSIASLLAFMISGSMPFIAAGWTAVIISRAIWGLAMGILMTIPRALSLIYYEGDDVARVNGWGTSINKIATTFIPTLAGVLSVISWDLTFTTFLLALIPLVAVLFLLPKEKLEKDQQPDENTSKPKTMFPKMSLGGWLCCLIPLFAYLAFLPTVFGLSGVIVGGGLGTAVEAGIAITLSNVVGIFIGFILGNMKKFFGDFLLPFQFIFVIAGCLFIGFASSLTMIYIGAFISGIGFPTTVAATVALSQKYITRNEAGVFSGVLSAAISIGATICPFYMTLVMNLSGGSRQSVFVVGATIFAVMSLIIIYTQLKDRKKLEV